MLVGILFSQSLCSGLSYTGSEIINVRKTKEQSEHNNTYLARPNRNNNASFVIRHFSPVYESLPPTHTLFDGLNGGVANTVHG